MAEKTEAQKDTIRHERMAKITRKIVVLSGKGGVGKSTVSVNLAASLAMAGKRVGLLDVDLHGPSIPTMLGLGKQDLHADNEGMYPAEIEGLNGLKVISVGFLLESHDQPLIWRGPMKNGVIKQFLGEVHWGELDYLIVDCPPGTGDEPLSVVQMMNNPDCAVIVTTPQNVSAVDVSKSINFCKQLSLPVAGIVENMSGFVCPDCGKVTEIFKSGGGKKLAEKYSIPFLGSVPLDPSVGSACDDGVPFVSKYAASPVAEKFRLIGTALMQTYPS
jgi:Mrp family chromosome partitioning ATPase